MVDFTYKLRILDVFARVGLEARQLMGRFDLFMQILAYFKLVLARVFTERRRAKHWVGLRNKICTDNLTRVFCR